MGYIFYHHASLLASIQLQIWQEAAILINYCCYYYIVSHVPSNSRKCVNTQVHMRCDGVITGHFFLQIRHNRYLTACPERWNMGFYLWVCTVIYNSSRPKLASDEKHSLVWSFCFNCWWIIHGCNQQIPGSWPNNNVTWHVLEASS